MSNRYSVALPEPEKIEEKLTRKILRPLMSQFPSLTEALLELVDNAVDAFDGRTGGQHLDIDLLVTKSSITVENIGGKGMGKNELREWLVWGEAHKEDAIGEYGQGGKAAMGYIGHSWLIKTKKWDEDLLWEIKEENWDDSASEEKHYLAKPSRYEKSKGLGYCWFEIRNLKKHRQDISRIRTELSNTYRTCLEQDKITIRLNHEKIAPFPLPLYDGFKIPHIAVCTADHSRESVSKPVLFGRTGTFDISTSPIS